MRHICAVIVICAAAFLGAGFAQDIPTDTSTALASEWTTPASTPHCLAALEIYATYSLAGIPVSPSQAADAALNELLSAFTGSDLARRTDLYGTAQKRPDFLDTLAKANSLKTTPVQAKALLDQADEVIRAIYDALPDGKQHLATVQASSAQKNYYLAIFQLLKAYPLSNPVDKRPYPQNLEILRAAFKINADQLFKLVSDKVLGKN